MEGLNFKKSRAGYYVQYQGGGLNKNSLEERENKEKKKRKKREKKREKKEKKREKKRKKEKDIVKQI